MSPLVIAWLVQGGMISTFAGIAYYIIRLLNREESLHADYPPHRHIYGSIIYPREYEPARTEKFGAD